MIYKESNKTEIEVFVAESKEKEILRSYNMEDLQEQMEKHYPNLDYEIFTILTISQTFSNSFPLAGKKDGVSFNNITMCETS